MSVRVRFAPSPTGPLHIGGLRTALYNYILAKKYKGTFILRIEDTDKKREVKNSENYILNALSWIGITPDEGPFSGGSYGPYRQSERNDIYKIYADKLIKNNSAYYAFDTESDLKKEREKLKKRGEAFKYGSSNRLLFKNSLTLKKENVLKIKERVIRLMVPEKEKIQVNDEIRGKIIVSSEELEDKVLIKADGSPTYHFANVIDDYLMNITHVIRGEEWLPSLPIHKLLYDSFGWDVPKFLHLPLILNKAGQGKLSKRDGEKEGFPIFPLKWGNSLGYKETGFLPGALVNYLILLGWSPGSDKELLKIKEVIDIFNEDKIHKGGARFDFEKAVWLNQKHIQNTDPKELLNEFPEFFKNIAHDEKLKVSIISLIKERALLLTDFEKESVFFKSEPKSYDLKSVSKLNKKNAFIVLKHLHDSLAGEKFALKNWKLEMIGWGKGKGVEPKEIMQAIRIALVGSLNGPDLVSVSLLIGEVRFLKRLKSFMEFLK